MARIRSLKPEFWTDEELATSVSRDGRMLYAGLWNLADEHGRLRGDPRYVKGQIFAYDDDLTPEVIDKLLDDLAALKKVVRYRVAGARYLFLPNLGKHQRLESDKVPSRLPGIDEAEPEPPPDQPEPSRANKSAPGADESALARARLGIREHGSGYGVPPSAGALALVPSESAPTAQDLVAEWIDHCRKRPPRTVIGQVGRQIKTMLDEGIDPTDIRAGLVEWWRKGVHPSVLPSMVNEVMNAAPARASPKRSAAEDRMASHAALIERLAAEEIA